LAAALIHGFPLDEARQADIRRKLDEHGREFADPFPPNPTEVR
jgi:hypothetical protein